LFFICSPVIRRAAVTRDPGDRERKSDELWAFEVFLRTGKRLARAAASELKFNPYHDPRNGQFTFAPGGPRSIADPIYSDRRGVWKKKLVPTTVRAERSAVVTSQPSVSDDTLPRALDEPPQPPFQLTGGGRSPRTPRNRNQRRQTDPMLLNEVFPGLAESPVGTIVRIADGILDLSTAANDLTQALHRAEVRKLLAQIRAIDPDYQFASLGEPQTIGGQANEIKVLRFHRALAFYRMRGELRPLQVEVLKIMQERADTAYDEAVLLHDEGRLTVQLSREEAIGNFVDRAVKADLRAVFNVNRVDTSRDQPVRVVGREYDTSGTDRTFRVPDARVGNIAFDVTLTEKTLKTPQVRGFFSSDFRPDVVVIVRPRQLGGSFTYAIRKPGG
jgi:hypothetical protein